MRSPTWAAVWIWARADLRRRWRSWAVLGLLGGVTLGLAAAGVAGARRTASAVPRAERAAHLADAAVLANSPEFDDAEACGGCRAPVRDRDVSIRGRVRAPGPERPRPRRCHAGADDRRGRAQHDRRLGRRPGARSRSGRRGRRRRERAEALPSRSRCDHDGRAVDLGRGSAGSFPPGLVPKNVDLNFRQQLRVVGITKSFTSDPEWIPSSGFYEKYGARMPGFVNEFVTMRGGQADLPSPDGRREPNRRPSRQCREHAGARSGCASSRTSLASSAKACCCSRSRSSSAAACSSVRRWCARSRPARPISRPGRRWAPTPRRSCPRSCCPRSSRPESRR